MLLDAGAEVDATSDAYGGGSTALELVATSAHPRSAGVQIPLIDLLLARGAAIDGVNPGGSTVASALANGCPEAAQALVERGARIDDIVTAASLGKIDLVKRIADKSSKADLEKALVRAAVYGWRNIVEYLLDAASTWQRPWRDGATRCGGQSRSQMTRMLLSWAPLEAKNRYGGTVLDGTL